MTFASSFSVFISAKWALTHLLKNRLDISPVLSVPILFCFCFIIKFCFSPLVYWYGYLLYPSLNFKSLRMKLLLIHLFTLTVSKHSTIEPIKTYLVGFLNGSPGKDSACQWRRFRRQEFIPWVEKIPRGGNAAHSRILAGEIPWTEGLAGLQSMGSKSVGTWLNKAQWRIELTMNQVPWYLLLLIYLSDNTGPELNIHFCVIRSWL